MGIVWISLATSILIAVAVMRALMRRPERDLGSVSPNWIAQNNSDAR
jgi:hypothetical protein